MAVMKALQEVTCLHSKLVELKQLVTFRNECSVRVGVCVPTVIYL